MDWLINITESARQFMPRVVSAVALLVLGWLLAYALGFVTNRLVNKVLARSKRHGQLDAAIDDSGVRSVVPRIVGGFVFWVVFLLFAVAAVESLGFTVITGVLSQVAYYLPNVLAAVVVMAAAVVGGRLARRAATAAARSAGIARADGVGQTTQAVVLLVALVVALDQIGIDAQLLVIVMTIVIGAAFASAGLAFALGAGTTVSNIVAAYYVAQAYSVGQRVRLGEIEGDIVQLTPTAVMLRTKEGRLCVPAKLFNEEASLLIVGAP